MKRLIASTASAFIALALLTVPAWSTDTVRSNHKKPIVHTKPGKPAHAKKPKAPKKTASPETSRFRPTPAAESEPMKLEIPATDSGPAAVMASAPPEPIIAKPAECPIRTGTMTEPPAIGQSTAAVPPETVNPYSTAAPVIRSPSPSSGNPYLPATIAVVTVINPYLRPTIARISPPELFPVLIPPETGWISGVTTIAPVPIIAFTDSFTVLKTKIFRFLPDGIGQMHKPFFLKFIDPGSGQRKVLVVQVSCPTKALFGFDTPFVAVIQICADQILEMLNAAEVFPADIKRVCE